MIKMADIRFVRFFLQLRKIRRCLRKIVVGWYSLLDIKHLNIPIIVIII